MWCFIWTLWVTKIFVHSTLFNINFIIQLTTSSRQFCVHLLNLLNKHRIPFTSFMYHYVSQVSPGKQRLLCSKLTQEFSFTTTNQLAVRNGFWAKETQFNPEKSDGSNLVLLSNTRLVTQSCLSSLRFSKQMPPPLPQAGHGPGVQEVCNSNSNVFPRGLNYKITSPRNVSRNYIKWNYSTSKSEKSILKNILRFDTGWTVRESNPVGTERFSTPVQTSPGAHPVSYTMSTGFLSRG
jgi:hypothetical protein